MFVFVTFCWTVWSFLHYLLKLTEFAGTSFLFCCVPCLSFSLCSAHSLSLSLFLSLFCQFPAFTWPFGYWLLWKNEEINENVRERNSKRTEPQLWQKAAPKSSHIILIEPERAAACSHDCSLSIYLVKEGQTETNVKGLLACSLLIYSINEEQTKKPMWSLLPYW